ncbi:MAG: radical SAM protein [Deltaproteobacteria bacterium]
MRALLVSVNREEINMPAWPLGLASVAASTENAGHRVSVLDLMMADDPHDALKEAIESARPEIIGLSVRNIDDQNMQHPVFYLDKVKKMVQTCRSRSDAPIVLGGAGYSLFPTSCLEYLCADMGIQGEGESVFPALLERMAGEESLAGLPGLFLAGEGLQGERGFVEDLDQLPLPRPELLFPSNHDASYFWLPVQTRRGCPLNCSYCSTSTIEGNRFRKRSPERVAQWISQWEEAGVRRFFFVDNTFNRPVSYAKALCTELANLSPRLEWRCILYPDKIDRELGEIMARSGCTEVSLGFESGSEQILHVLNKRFKPEDVKRASKILADHGIRQTGFLLLGGPGETRETVEESLSFADSLKLDAVKITRGIRIYPYTELARIAVDQGIVSPDDDLLLPRFYCVPGLEAWLEATVEDWTKDRPNWLV